MRLIVDNTASADPVVPVRWCFSKQELSTMASTGRESQVLLVVVYDDGTEDRAIRPASEIMTYISFRRPGQHCLLGALIQASSRKQEYIFKKVSYRKYEYQIAEDGRLVGLHYYDDIATADSILITVPAEHFPGPPPKWMKEFADLGFSFPANDQCQLRRRMLGIPFKAVGLAIWFCITTVIRIIVASTLWAGTVRGVKFSPIWHPWRDDINDIIPYGSWFMNSRIFVDDQGEVRHSSYFLLHPWLWAIIFAITTAVKIRLHTTYLKMLLAVGKLLWLLISNWTIIVPFVILVWAVSLLGLKISGDDWAEKMKTRRLARAQMKVESAKALLTCDSGLQPNASSIPLSHRSVNLMYKGLKRKVCRPFAN